MAQRGPPGGVTGLFSQFHPWTVWTGLWTFTPPLICFHHLKGGQSALASTGTTIVVPLGPVVPRAVGRLALSPEEAAAHAAGGDAFGDAGVLSRVP